VFGSIEDNRASREEEYSRVDVKVRKTFELSMMIYSVEDGLFPVEEKKVL